MKAYLDTNAWNAIAAWGGRRSRRRFDDIDILFSSVNLDEIAAGSYHHAREVAEFAWRVSNRRQLADHILLTFREIEAAISGELVWSIYRNDPKFSAAWHKLRREGLTAEERSLIREPGNAEKRVYRSWLREVRKVFGETYERFAKVGLAKGWPKLLQELEDEGYIRNNLRQLIQQEGTKQLLAMFDSAGTIAYRELPGTAAWVQYYLALPFLAGQRRGKVTHPDSGDQADFRHAAYSGYVDLFVTDDARMMHVLEEFVVDKKASVIGTEHFISRFLGGDAS